MRFPFEANDVHDEGRFLIQDPEYRKRILPLFEFAPGEPERRVVGQGTVFRIDPFGNCATAFHVFESAFYLGGATGREMVVRQDRSIVALELDGIAYGAEPVNLGRGWKRYDFTSAFGCPTKVVNDALMQALGSFDGGKMLFSGFGTGLGSAMIVNGTLVPMELGHLPYRRGKRSKASWVRPASSTTVRRNGKAT